MAQPSTSVKPRGSLDPIGEHEFGYEQARHLLWRAGFGGTPEQIQLLASWGPRKAVDYLVDYEQVEYDDPGARLNVRHSVLNDSRPNRDCHIQVPAKIHIADHAAIQTTPIRL